MTLPNDDICVLVTASPIPSHPETTVIDQCLTSVRDRLPEARILILCDGIREGMEHRADAYDLFVHAVKADVNCERWGDAEVVTWAEHQHQARMVRHALANLVNTPLVLLMEADCELVGDIPFDAHVNLLHSGEARLLRYHHEASVLQPHEWLNVHGGQVEIVQGVPVIATAQYSARPHLADSDWYRWVLGPEFFHPDSRVFAEDILHGVVLEHWRNEGTAGWDRHRLWIYAEPDENGSIKRSATMDGRQDDPKAPNVPLPLEIP